MITAGIVFQVLVLEVRHLSELTLHDLLQGWWMLCTRQHFEALWVDHYTWIQTVLAHTQPRQ